MELPATFGVGRANGSDGMEAALILLLLVVLVVAFALSRKDKSDPPIASVPKGEPKPFDHQTAEPAQEVLAGAAYVVDGDTITIKNSLRSTWRG